MINTRLIFGAVKINYLAKTQHIGSLAVSPHVCLSTANFNNTGSMINRTKFESISSQHSRNLSYLLPSPINLDLPSQNSHGKTEFLTILKGNILSKNWKQPCRFAGHSKWQNIRHIKGAKDAQKQKQTDKITRDLKVAIREGGSPDPKLNAQLRRVIERANALNIPKTTINNTLKIIEKSGKDAKVMFVEARGPLSSMLIIEACTNKSAHTRNTIQSVLKKFGGTIGDGGTAAHSFDFKGIVQTPIPETGAMDLDKAEELAIDIGAEEVTITEDENDRKVFQFVCDTKDLHSVKVGVEGHGLEIVAARLAYLPTLFVDIDNQNQEALAPMFERLEDIEEVVRIFDNFNFKSIE